MYQTSNKAVYIVLVIGILLGALAGFTISYTTLSNKIQFLQNEVNTLARNQLALEKIASVPVEPVETASYQGMSNLSTLYQKTVSSVVEIEAIQQQVIQGIFGFQVEQVPVLGSGFVVEYNKSFYIITNYHVVENATSVAVKFYDGRSYPAKIVGEDRFSDLAVLSVNAQGENIKPLPLANSSQLQVGDTVVAIGNPFGLSNTFTVGVVSALNRILDDPVAAPYSIAGVIQITTPINPGNSGGPLLDLAGQVVGVTTAIIANSQGLGFAIPSNVVARELPYLVATGRYDLHPYFGFSVVTMNYYIARAMNTSVTYGVLVQQVLPNSPAAKAGLKGGSYQAQILGEPVWLGGDIILAVNGTPVQGTSDLLSYLQLNVLPGETVVFTIYRVNETVEIPLIAGYLPEENH